MLRHKVLFGSDYPVIAPDRWIDSFESLSMRDEVVPLIMKQNAIGVLGLGLTARAPAPSAAGARR